MEKMPWASTGDKEAGRVGVEGRRVLYAGEVCPRPEGETGGPAEGCEVRGADVVVLGSAATVRLSSRAARAYRALGMATPWAEQVEPGALVEYVRATGA